MIIKRPIRIGESLRVVGYSAKQAWDMLAINAYFDRKANVIHIRLSTEDMLERFVRLLRSCSRTCLRVYDELGEEITAA